MPFDGIYKQPGKKCCTLFAFLVHKKLISIAVDKWVIETGMDPALYSSSFDTMSNAMHSLLLPLSPAFATIVRCDPLSNCAEADPPMQPIYHQYTRPSANGIKVVLVQLKSVTPSTVAICADSERYHADCCGGRCQCVYCFHRSFLCIFFCVSFNRFSVLAVCRERRGIGIAAEPKNIAGECRLYQFSDAVYADWQIVRTD